MFKSQKSQLCKSQIGGLALNRRKWPEMGSKWSPGPENRSPGFSRPFPRLWDRSRGPKPPKYSPNSRSTAPGGRYVRHCPSMSQRSRETYRCNGVASVSSQVPAGATQARSVSKCQANFFTVRTKTNKQASLTQRLVTVRPTLCRTFLTEL